MPGFEAISVVLAVIPLFISAAEHYRDGLNSINRLWKKERILQKYIEDLSIQRTLLDEFSQSLLIDVDLDISVKVQLLEDVNGDVWNQPAVKRKLDATLGPVRNAFTTLLQRIDQALISQLADESMIRYKGETIVFTSCNTHTKLSTNGLQEHSANDSIIKPSDKNRERWSV